MVQLPCCSATPTEGGLPFYEMYRKELTVEFPRAALPRDYDTAVEVGDLLSASFPLDRGDEAFEALRDRSGLLKVTLEVA